MTGIDRERWRTLDPLLDEALELPTPERAGWLAALRAHSPTLAAELTALLSGEAAADERGFLTEPLATPLSAPRAGLRLGGYVLERTLGHGGMGTVWLARRADGRFEGRVAIKFLHHALLEGSGQARFRREGSVLARLAHPNIARLLDAGVAASGQPYLVLEHVAGQPIDAFADARRLTTAERLRLVLQVLAAVGHAHARLVIHRDLKPSNILVTDDGTAKLLDFGIAKLIAADGDERRTALTSEGFRALTPEFAAPEQLVGDPITTATDVFAVGVLLFALLTGRRPYDLAGRSFAEIARLVCGTDAPRPSATFVPPLGGEDRDARARVRGSTADRLHRQLRGDADAIVLKALHREPARRYQSVTALAEDIERHLEGRPVLASPDGTAYRLRKFVGRHRRSVALAAAGVALLAGGAVRERTLRARAEAEARKAHAVEDYLVSVFEVADPYAPPSREGGDVTARALLDRGAARLDSVLAGQPEAQAELRGVLGQVYRNLGLFDAAAPLLRRALEQQRALHGPRHPAVAAAMDRLGAVAADQNRFDEAEPLLRESLAQRRALFGTASAQTAESLDHLATLLQQRNALAAAEPLFREAVAVRRAVHGAGSEQEAEALGNLSVLLYVRGRYDAADPLARQALAILERRLGRDHPRTAMLVHNLAQVEQARGRFTEAEALYRRALAAKRRTLGELHPSVTVNMNNLGLLLAVELGRPEEGEALIRGALARDRRIFGARHSYVAESLRNLGTVLRLKGDLDEAERIYDETLVMNRALFGPEHARVATALSNLAQMRQLRGDLPGAIALHREALAMFARTLGERHRNYAAVSLNLAGALRESGDPAAAERLFRATEPRLDTTSMAQRTQLVALLVGLGQSVADQGRVAEALPTLERGLAASRARFGERHWRTAEARLALGSALAAAGQGGRAEPLVRAAAATLQRNRRAQPRLAARADSALQALERTRGA